jgi:hypothetical protein
MERKIGKATIMIAVLLMTMALMANLPTVKASGTIYIRPDGSIDPPTAPIQKNGDVYTLTGNITSETDGIVIEKDNMILDGADYIIQGPGTESEVDTCGILSERSNITIKNMKITKFTHGIVMHGNGIVIYRNDIYGCFGSGIALGASSSNSVLYGNKLTNNCFGIEINGASNITIIGNSIANCSYGIELDTFSKYNNVIGNRMINAVKGLLLIDASYNIIRKNKVINSWAGILLHSDGFGPSSNNTICENSVINSNVGIWIGGLNNLIFHNDFINNTNQAWVSGVNIFDNGYPSGGNYWSEYKSTDEKSGPNQDQPGSDSIWDTPYIINQDNKDHYPFVNPYVRDVIVTTVTSSKTVVGQGYSLNINVTIENQGDYIETFNVTLYANTTEIGTQEITLLSGNSTTLTFTWNTTGFAKGNYTISAYAWPVPGEIDTADNNVSSITPVHIGVPGNVWGNPSPPPVYDDICNMRDVTYLILHFNTKPESPNWDPNTDVNDDGVCNMRDVTIAILNFNKHE